MSEPREGAVTAPQLNRALLREAGEHVGTLAERRKEVYEFYVGNHRASETRKKFWNEYAKLWRLSREILELANGD